MHVYLGMVTLVTLYPPPPTPWKCDEKSGQGQSVYQVIHSLIFQVIIYF